MNPSHLSEQFAEEISPTQAIEFSYDMLDDATRIVVQQRTTEIKALLRRTAQDIIDVGLKLSEVKQELGHGNFLAWLRREFDWSESAARKFMQVSRQFKTVKFTNLNIAPSALYLLSADSTPESAREEALQLADSGEVITRHKAKAIVQQHTRTNQPNNDIVDVKAESSPTLKIASDSNSQPNLPDNSNCYLEVSDRLHLLNEAQIAAIWQLLSQHLNPKHLTWHNWSRERLERLIAQVQQELSRR